MPGWFCMYQALPGKIDTLGHSHSLTVANFLRKKRTVSFVKFSFQGEIHCKFYSRYGICKFGPNCKFDHPMAAPMGVYAYGYSPASLTNMAGVNR